MRVGLFKASTAEHDEPRTRMAEGGPETIVYEPMVDGDRHAGPKLRAETHTAQNYL